jgi:hypothetical protein
VRYLERLHHFTIDYRYLRGFLKYSLFGNLALQPRDFIPRLPIKVPCFISRDVESTYAILRETLKGLTTTLRYDQHLTIELHLDRGHQFSRTVSRFLEILRPFVCSVEVKIMGHQFFAGAVKENPLNNSEDWEDTVEHLESYDDGTSQEWVAKRAKEFVNIEYKGHRRRCNEINCTTMYMDYG